MSNEIISFENVGKAPVANEMLQMEGLDRDFIGEITSKTVALSSIDLTNATREEKIQVFNAINGECKRIAECVNMPIKICNIYIEEVVLKQDDGTLQKCPRIILLDEENVGYCAVSVGVHNCLKKIVQMFGMPSEWEDGFLTVIPKTIKKGNKSITTLDLAL